MAPNSLSGTILTAGISACATLLLWLCAGALGRLGLSPLRRHAPGPGASKDHTEDHGRSAASQGHEQFDPYLGLVEGLASAAPDMEAKGHASPEETAALAVDLLERMGRPPDEIGALRARLERGSSVLSPVRPPRALIDRLRALLKAPAAPQPAAEDAAGRSSESRLLFVNFEQEIRTAERRKSPLTLFDLRIEGFDTFEERFGRAATDRILRGVARAIRSQLRPDDTCVRDAGGAFLVLVPGLAAEAVQALSKRIESAVARHKFALERGRSVLVEATLCSATLPQDGRSYDALLTVARTRRALTNKGRVASGPASGPFRPYPHRIDAPVN